MKKAIVINVIWLSIVSFIGAETIVLKAIDNGQSTGEMLEGTSNTPKTVSVQEFDGLEITAQTDNPLHKIHTTKSGNSLGIDSEGRKVKDNNTRLETGEKLTLSFNHDLSIKSFDFIGFDTNSQFIVDVAGQDCIKVKDDDLSNKKTQQLLTDITLKAGSTIDLYVGTTNSVIGLQGIDIKLVD